MRLNFGVFTAAEGLSGEWRRDARRRGLCRGEFRWRLLRWRLRNRGSCPWKEPEAGAPDFWRVDRAARQVCGKRAERCPGRRGTAEWSSARAAGDSETTRYFPRAWVVPPPTLRSWWFRC